MASWQIEEEKEMSCRCAARSDVQRRSGRGGSDIAFGGNKATTDRAAKHQAD